MQECLQASLDMREAIVFSEASCSDDEYLSAVSDEEYISKEQYISPSAREAAEDTEFVSTPSPWFFAATLHPSFMSAGQQTGPGMQDPLSMLVASAAAAAANPHPMPPPPQYVPSVLPETWSTGEPVIAQSIASITRPNDTSVFSRACQQPSLTAMPPIHIADLIEGAASKEDLAQGKVEAFVARWGLNRTSAAIIEALPHVARQNVLQNFNANALTRDVNAKLMSWLSSKMKSRDELQSCLSTTTQERQEFYRRWKLDARCRMLVEEQPQHVQRELVSNFNPPPGTTNVAGRMTAFLRMILNKPGQRCFHRQSVEVEQFISRWGLDVEASSLLAKLPRDMQDSVLQDFNPVCEPSLVSRKFTAYVKSRRRGKSS